MDSNREMKPFDSTITKNNTLDRVELEFENMTYRTENVTNPISQPTPTPLPEIPKKVLIVSVILLITGIVLIIFGFIDDIRKNDPGNGVTLWVFGGLVLLPGAYYSFKIFMAFISNDPDAIALILSDIPIFE